MCVFSVMISVPPMYVVLPPGEAGGFWMTTVPGLNITVTPLCCATNCSISARSQSSRTAAVTLILEGRSLMAVPPLIVRSKADHPPATVGQPEQPKTSSVSLAKPTRQIEETDPERSGEDHDTLVLSK